MTETLDSYGESGRNFRVGHRPGILRCAMSRVDETQAMRAVRCVTQREWKFQEALWRASINGGRTWIHF